MAGIFFGLEFFLAPCKDWNNIRKRVTQNGGRLFDDFNKVNDKGVIFLANQSGATYNKSLFVSGEHIPGKTYYSIDFILDSTKNRKIQDLERYIIFGKTKSSRKLNQRGRKRGRPMPLPNEKSAQSKQSRVTLKNDSSLSKEQEKEQPEQRKATLKNESSLSKEKVKEPPEQRKATLKSEPSLPKEQDIASNKAQDIKENYRKQTISSPEHCKIDKEGLRYKELVDKAANQMSSLISETQCSIDEAYRALCSHSGNYEYALNYLRSSESNTDYFWRKKHDAIIRRNAHGIKSVIPSPDIKSHTPIEDIVWYIVQDQLKLSESDYDPGEETNRLKSLMSRHGWNEVKFRFKFLEL